MVDGAAQEQQQQHHGAKLKVMPNKSQTAALTKLTNKMWMAFRNG